MSTNVRTADAEPSDLDRIALSHSLYELSDSFTQEAALWNAVDAKRECERAAASLADIARHVPSGRADYARAEAYRDAAARILANVIGCRRFFASLTRGPRRGSL